MMTSNVEYVCGLKVTEEYAAPIKLLLDVRSMLYLYKTLLFAKRVQILFYAVHATRTESPSLG